MGNPHEQFLKVGTLVKVATLL